MKLKYWNYNYHPTPFPEVEQWRINRLRKKGYKSFEQLEDMHKQGVPTTGKDYLLVWALNHQAAYGNIPRGTKLPILNEIWKSKTKCSVPYLVGWRAPLTTGGKCEFPEGEKVKITYLKSTKPLIISCRPVNYESMEMLLIPEETRLTPKYDGFGFSIPAADFLKNFEYVCT